MPTGEAVAPHSSRRRRENCVTPANIALADLLICLQI